MRGKGPLARCVACKVDCLLSGELAQELFSGPQMTSTIHYKKGETIFEQGEPVNGSYLICEGVIKEGWRNPLGKKITLRLLPPGNLLASAAFWEKELWHDTYCVALTNTRLLFIRNSGFKALLANPGVAVDLSKKLAKNLALLKKRIELITCCVEKRIANLLLDMERLNSDTFTCTNKELAELAGCTPVTVSKCLNHFIRKGLISRNGKFIEILDENSLSEKVPELSFN